MAVYAVADSFGEERPVFREYLPLVAPDCRTAVQRGEKRTDVFGCPVQLFVLAVWRALFFERQKFLIGARLREGQARELDTDGVVQPGALFAKVGMGRGERVLLKPGKNGILHGLPPADVSRQGRERGIGLPPYIGQILPVDSGRVVGCLDRRFAVSAATCCQYGYGKRGGAYPR